MKCLVLKDLYNIGHNAGAMLLVLAAVAAAVVPASGAAPYMASCAVMCAMMLVTTFTFDEASGWTAYALVLPVTRRQVVAAKFAVLALFDGVGCLFGLAVSGGASLLLGGRLPPENGPLVLLAMLPLSWAIAFAMGSAAIPLAFHFGAENARLLVTVAFVIPAMLFLAAVWVLGELGVVFSGGALTALVCALPLAALAWGWAMYRIACRVFEKQEC